MKSLATWKICVFAAALFLCPPCGASDFDLSASHNTRVLRHKDGSRSTFTRSPDRKVLTKETTRNGVLVMRTTYFMDASGNPRGCKIKDGSGEELFKVSYGYHRMTGLLVEELMFDSRVRRINPANGKEMPLQRLAYVYDAEGKRSAPMAFNYLPGKTYEQIFGEKSSALEVNPFDEAAPSRR